MVVISTRVPKSAILESDEKQRTKSVSGLVSALHFALQDIDSLWFGWSGQAVTKSRKAAPQKSCNGSIELVTVDLTLGEVDGFYTGFCNSTLWPLFHCLPSYVRLCQNAYQTYQIVNRDFAAILISYLREDDLVWVHDYQHIPIGTELRRLGWMGRLGFFLHTPFPPIDILEIIPQSKQILENLMDYDLLGFNTQRYCKNFIDALCKEFGGTFDGRTYYYKQLSVHCNAYPTGINPSAFEFWVNSADAIEKRRRIRESVYNRRIVLGVDRLDYTKGICERLLAFEQFLERYPYWRKQVSMIQISVPSRDHMPEYAAYKQEIDRLVGNINSRFSEDEWLPVVYLYRSYLQEELSAFYREADVCFVTSLRDGMNLVAKEYIASQSNNFGVLVLSKFCGASEDLQEAIIINPYDIYETANALKFALEMPNRERSARWQALMKRVCNHTAGAWRDCFLTDLQGFAIK
ncbi:MAG: trehalose-6-phosphate synthase [Scytonema sp. CRU_2_7]|nr:trehalose-6-phosphate synthase [Scytonema sp. CRU_2_7]